MRATKHNSRGVKGSSRGYTANHNDRNFKYQDAEHIKTDKVQTNIYWNWTSVKEYKHTDKGTSFDEAEARYYERFRHQWEAQCERNEKARHSERNKTFDDWRNSKRYCPEEVYMQVGNHEKHIDNATTYKIMRDYIAFERQFAREHNNCCQILDYAFHFDEDVPQLHYRRVWQSKNADGRFEIGQNKALETSGLELPYPDEPIKEEKKENKCIKFLKTIYEYLQSPYFILHFCRIGVIFWLYVYRNYPSVGLLIWLFFSFLVLNIKKMKYLTFIVKWPCLLYTIWTIHISNIKGILLQDAIEDDEKRIKYEHIGLRKWEKALYFLW